MSTIEDDVVERLRGTQHGELVKNLKSSPGRALKPHEVEE
jgi:hypothetical protein